MLDLREPKIHNPERELIALDLIGKMKSRTAVAVLQRGLK